MHAEDRQCHLYVIVLSQQNREGLGDLQRNSVYQPLPEINSVRADMTRTSLVDGITPFCFTCADNIRLVCGKCKETENETKFYLSEASTPVATLQGFTALCITTALRTSWVLGLAIATANTASSE